MNLVKASSSNEISTLEKGLEAKVAEYAKANNMKESDAWAAYEEILQNLKEGV